MKLLILASGRGSRLKKNTLNKPKCLVHVLKKPIISYVIPSFNQFKEVIMVVGYKSNQIKTYLRNITKVRFINNPNFSTTNMVESLFLANDYINDDVIIIYSDIIFDLNLLEELKKTTCSTVPIYKNWYALWQKRMNEKTILLDAEDLKIENKKIISIGEEIGNIVPDYQFMGIIKINKNDYKKLYEFYLSINDKKIDLTGFLNKCIHNDIMNFSYLKTIKEWMEIDTEKDLTVAEQILKLRHNS